MAQVRASRPYQSGGSVQIRIQHAAKALDVLRRFQESIPDLIQKDYSDYKAMLTTE